MRARPEKKKRRTQGAERSETCWRAITPKRTARVVADTQLWPLWFPSWHPKVHNTTAVMPILDRISYLFDFPRLCTFRRYTHLFTVSHAFSFVFLFSFHFFAFVPTCVPTPNFPRDDYYRTIHSTQPFSLSSFDQQHRSVSLIFVSLECVRSLWSVLVVVPCRTKLYFLYKLSWRLSWGC